jgi:DNA-binding transcriptional ArsR family regulator
MKMKTLTMKKPATTLLNFPSLRESVLVFRSVNHKLRQRMLEIIDANEAVSVTDLYIKLRIDQSLCSQHLAILRRAGVVNAERQGKLIWYSVNYKRLNQLNKIAEELSGTRTVGVL